MMISTVTKLLFMIRTAGMSKKSQIQCHDRDTQEEVSSTLSGEQSEKTLLKRDRPDELQDRAEVQ